MSAFIKRAAALLCGVLLNSSFLFSQADTASTRQAGAVNAKPKLTLNAYVDAYYGYNAVGPKAGTSRPYLYASARSNEFDVNVALLDAKVSAERFRGRAAFGIGTYFLKNYEAEPGLLQEAFELSAGVKLLPDRELWLDAGVMPSPIGYEGALSKDR